MTEYRDILERQLELLAPPRIPIDRLTRRRDRKRRNQRITAGLVAAAISVLAISGLIRAFSPSPETGSPSPPPVTPVADLSYVDLTTGESTPLPASIRDVPGIRGVQVSPDGSMFTFESAEPSGVRQVYVSDVEGSHIRRISHGTWQAFHPSWSPDGTQILYEGLAVTQSVGIYVADASGEGRRRVVTLAADATYPPYAAMPRFSPDGTQILFTRKASGSIGLWTTTVDGASSHRVLGGAAFGSYSPDGRTIVYRHANLSPGLQTGISFYGDVVPAIGEQTGKLPMGAFYGIRLSDSHSAMPVWSPDGERVLYADPFADFNESHPMYIFDVTSDDRTPVGQGSEASWFDDDTLIVRGYVHPADDKSASPSPSSSSSIGAASPADLHFLDLSTGRVTPLPRSITTIPEIGGIQVSPDGRSLAFEGAPDPGGLQQIFVGDVDGSNVRQLTFSDDIEATHPSWSPDQTRIIYDSSSVGDVAVSVVDVRTEVSTTLVSASHLSPQEYFDPVGSFLADGAVLFARVDGNSSDLWRVPIDGGEPEKLVADAAYGAASPNGKWIAYRTALLLPGLQKGFSLLSIDGSPNPSGPPGGTLMGPLIEIDEQSAILDWSPDSRRVAYADPFGNIPPYRVHVFDVSSGRLTEVGGGTQVTWFDNDTLIVRDYRGP